MAHIPHGVEKDDYNSLGEALIKSLEQALGDKFDYELKRAWSLVFESMKQGIISNNYEE